MKQLLLIHIILAALSTPVGAATVQAVATDVLATYGGFSQTPGGTTALNEGEIKSIITGDPATSVYGLSATDYSVIDLGFGNTTVVTGQGADLVIFSLWHGYDYNFGLQAFDNSSTPNLLSSYNYTVDGSSLFSNECINDGNGGCAYVSATSINLFDNNNNASALNNDIELGYISLFIGGNAYNGASGGVDAYSNFSLVGAYHAHTEATVVPLPLPAILFGSGLALLGWVGRRKNT